MTALKRMDRARFSALFEKRHPEPEALEEMLQYVRLSDRALTHEQAEELQ